MLLLIARSVLMKGMCFSWAARFGRLIGLLKQGKNSRVRRHGLSWFGHLIVNNLPITNEDSVPGDSGSQIPRGVFCNHSARIY